MGSSGAERAAVSVVVPTRDRAALLRRTLRTALWQEAVDLEVVVVDDGSTDETAQMVSSLGDARVRLVRNDGDHGVSHARNLGIASADGNWIAFLDDDDLWAPSKLRQQLERAEERSAAWAFSSAVHVLHGPELWTLQPVPTPESAAVGAIERRNVVPAGASNVVARRDILERVGGFDPRLRHLADWHLWRRLAAADAPATLEDYHVAYWLHAHNWLLKDLEGVHDEFDLIVADDPREVVDPIWLDDWIAGTLRRAGRHRAAATVHLRAARRDHPLRSALHAARALVPIADLRRTVLRRPAAAWPADVRGWLERALDAEPAASASGGDRHDEPRSGS